MKKNYLLIALVLFLFSCQKEDEIVLPDPEFEISDLFGYKADVFAIKEMVRVESVSQADSYFWEFGDGTTSREINPVHLYQEPGTYTLRLTVRRNGAARTVGRVIKVGTYYADEVRLVNYADSFWVDGRKSDVHTVAEPTNLYMTMSKLFPEPAEEIQEFKSELLKEVDKETLPLSVAIPDIRMDNMRFQERVDFFAKATNGEEGIVASNWFVTGATTYYSSEENVGYTVVGRGTTPGDGFEIRVYFKRKMAN